jgi:anti-sigma regulatory factor (Ser/Thr protein kinase)
LSETVHLKIGPDSQASNADNLHYLQGEVEELGQREEWPDSLVFKVNLVLEELGLNILSYGGSGADRRPEIEIVLISEDDSLTIEVLDDGQPFNPLADAVEPDIEAILDDRPVGGLGVHLVRTLMDDLSYQRAAGRNLLKMVSKRE